MRKPKVNARSAAVAVLDQRLVAKVKRLSRAKTTRKAVQVALEHYTKSRNYSKVLSLYGSGGVTTGYDPKTSNPA